eukprot:425620_1
MSWLKINYVRQDRLWWRFGCISAASAVTMGAMGAHWVQPTDRYEKTFKTGSQYHFIHSIGLLLGILFHMHAKLNMYQITILFILNQNSITSISAT